MAEGDVSQNMAEGDMRQSGLERKVKADVSSDGLFHGIYSYIVFNRNCLSSFLCVHRQATQGIRNTRTIPITSKATRARKIKVKP